MGLVILSLGLILTYVPVLGLERNLRNISLFFACYALSIVGMRLLGTKMLERMKPFTAYLTAIILQCAALLLLAAARSLAPVLIGAACYGSAFAMVQPLLNFMQIRALPSHKKGMAGAVYFFALDIGFATGSTGFGYPLEISGFGLRSRIRPVQPDTFFIVIPVFGNNIENRKLRKEFFYGG